MQRRARQLKWRGCNECWHVKRNKLLMKSSQMNTLLVCIFSDKGICVHSFTPPDGWSTETLIKNRPHNKYLHFLLLKRSAATFGVCLHCVSEERKPWKEISVQMCLQSLLSVPVPTSQPLFPGFAPSRVLHGEQEAGPGSRPCCRQAKESGYEASA